VSAAREDALERARVAALAELRAAPAAVAWHAQALRVVAGFAGTCQLGAAAALAASLAGSAQVVERAPVLLGLLATAALAGVAALAHHVGAWIFVAAACVLVSRRLRPRAFAP
jgi:hypothetical protein